MTQRRLDVSEWCVGVQHAVDSGYSYFDWLTAVDHSPAAEVDAAAAVRGSVTSVDLVVHLLRRDPWDRLHLVTTLTAGADGLLPPAPSLTGIFVGAAWHEREVHEMFGIDFTGFRDGTEAGMRPLLLPEGFQGHPLRKSFVLAARAVKPWPGAVEPGEAAGADPTNTSGATRAPAPGQADQAPPETAPARRPRRRRRQSPPGVPEPEWGPR